MAGTPDKGDQPDKGTSMTSAYAQSELPLHPTKVHPRTGVPLRAIFVSTKTGRVFWPIIGAAEGDPPEGETPEQKTARETAEADAKKDTKVNDAGNVVDDEGRDLGFPAKTPVKEMKPEQQAAYHSHTSKRHEKRASGWYKHFGEDVDPGKVKEELETLRREKMTEAEKAVEDAKKGGATEASKRAARSMLELALDHVDDERRTLLLSTTDVSSVINENGDIDTAKVKSLAQALAPGKGSGDSPDLGQGRRGSQTKGGVAAGRSLYQERHGKKQSSTSDS